MYSKIGVLIACFVTMAVCVVAIINGIKQRKNKLHLVIAIIAAIVFIACSAIFLATAIQ